MSDQSAVLTLDIVLGRVSWQCHLASVSGFLEVFIV